MATSLDGRIATATGKSRWITGPEARERAHLFRAMHDAVLVGTGTALADDPQLTCRLAGLEDRSPVRIVIDRQLRLPTSLRLFVEALSTPSWIVTSSASDPARQDALRKLGVAVIAVEPDGAGGIDLATVLRALGERDLTRLLVEGGGRLAAELLRAGLVDRLAWLHAPLLIGGDGIPAVAALGLDELAGAPRFTPVASERVGADVLETYRKIC